MFSKLEQHNNLLKDLSLRKFLLEKFIPTFCYHPDEQNFPVHPDQAIKNIIEVKRDEYLHIQQRHGRALTEIEQEELEAIHTYFWNHDTNTFNDNYKVYQNNPMFIALSKKPSQLLIFDEKHYGYQVGEKIDVIGIAPHGHKKHNPNKEQAPITASIIPTEEGFFIQYEYLYTLNNAIYGMQWLRRILPEWLCKKVSEFGFHYGDSEGVGLHIKLEDGKASIQAMQTWAHGRDYAELAQAKDCHFDEHGNVCVYVGVGGHPSYASNFIGRNLPMDLVGDAYRIRAEQVIDVSRDVVQAASDIANIDNQADLDEFNGKNPLAKLAHAIPGSISSIRRFADSNPLAFNSMKDETQLKNNFINFKNYHPWLLLAKIKDFILNLFSKKEKRVEPLSFDLPPLQPATQLTTILDPLTADDAISFGRASNASSLSLHSFFSACDGTELEDVEYVPIEDTNLSNEPSLPPVTSFMQLNFVGSLHATESPLLNTSNSCISNSY